MTILCTLTIVLELQLIQESRKNKNTLKSMTTFFFKLFIFVVVEYTVFVIGEKVKITN